MEGVWSAKQARIRFIGGGRGEVTFLWALFGFPLPPLCTRLKPRRLGVLRKKIMRI